MGALLDSRRRQVAAKGRAQVLRRAGVADLPVTASDHAYAPHELLGGLMQGDLRVEITNDEITAAAWPVPIRKPDVLVIDGRSYTVQGAASLHEGGACIGWSIWARSA